MCDIYMLYFRVVQFFFTLILYKYRSVDVYMQTNEIRKDNINKDLHNK